MHVPLSPLEFKRRARSLYPDHEDPLQFYFLPAAPHFTVQQDATGRFPQFPPLIDEVPALAVPWLGLFGDLDESIPVDDVEILRAALEATAVDTEVVRYGDADHGFHCDQRPSYHQAAAHDAWARTLAWFAAHLT